MYCKVLHTVPVIVTVFLISTVRTRIGGISPYDTILDLALKKLHIQKLKTWKYVLKDGRTDYEDLN